MSGMGDFAAFYATELVPHLQGLEQKRKQVAGRVIGLGIVVLAVIAVTALITWMFTWDLEASEFLSVFVPVTVVCGLGYMLAYYLMTKGFVAEFKDAIIGRIVRFVSPDLVYRKDGGIGMQAYKQSQLFLQHPHRYRAEDLVQGTMGKTAIRFSEVHSEYKTEHTDSKGKRTVQWHTIFKGIFFIADFNKHFNGETVVLPDFAERMLGRLGQSIQSLNISRKGRLVRLEDPEFEKRFVVFSEDQIEARYILSTSLMARITDFANRTGRQVYLSFVASQLNVAISYHKDLFEPKLFRSLLDMKLTQEYLEDLLLATSIVDDLNLNLRIWSKQ